MSSDGFGLTVRRALLEDAPRLVELSAQLGYRATLEETAERLELLLSSSDDAVFVADRDGQVIGCAHVFVARRLASPPFAELGGLVVAEGSRRLGVGRRLVERAARWASAKSLGRLRVRTRTTRAGAHEFYAALSFERVKDQAVYERATAAGSTGGGS